MPAQGIHSCCWFCELPNCVKAQRDELRERITELQDNGNRLLAVADSAAAHQREMIEAACAPLHERIAILERDGPQMQRGITGGGTVWMGSMRECLNDARSCADAEASIADALVTENKVLRAHIADLEAAKENLCKWLLSDATCPCCEAEDVCADGCTFADDAPDDAESMEEIRAVLRAAIGTPRPQPESAVSGPALTRS